MNDAWTCNLGDVRDEFFTCIIDKFKMVHLVHFIQTSYEMFCKTLIASYCADFINVIFHSMYKLTYFIYIYQSM